MKIDLRDSFFILIQLFTGFWPLIAYDQLSTAFLGTGILVNFVFGVLYFVLVKKYPVFHFLIFFWGVAFVFYASSIVLYLLYGDLAMFFWRVNDLTTYNYSIALINCAFGSSFIAACIDFKKKIKTPKVEHSQKGLLGIGVLFFSVSVLAITYYSATGRGLNLLIQQGYTEFADARKGGELPVLLFASLNMFLPWSVLILTVYVMMSDKIKNIYLYVFIITPAIILMFMSGDRTAPLAALVLIFIAFKLINLKSKPGKAKVFTPGNIMFLAVIIILAPVVKNWRLVGGTVDVSDVSFVGQQEAIQGNIILDLAYNTSTSMQTLVGTTKLVPEREDYRLGYDYLKSAINAIPFSVKVLDGLGIDFKTREAGLNSRPSQWITYHFNRGDSMGLGFLLISEAYLQFGLLGVILVHVLLTFLLKRMQNTFVERDDANMRAFLLIVMMSLFIWIRNDSSGLVKTIVWPWLIIYPLSSFIDYFLSSLRRTTALFNAKELDSGEG